MNAADELDGLRRELADVLSRPDPSEPLPAYGWCTPAEAADLLRAELARLERLRDEEEQERHCQYHGDELERERDRLCLSLGISRYC